MPSVVFTPEQKTQLAHQISEFGADCIELMPAVSETEAKLAKNLIENGLRKKLTASAMISKRHIDRVADIGFKYITLFTPLSDIQLKHKLKITREDNKAKSQEMVDYARGSGLEVAFAGEDSTRANINYLIDFIKSLGKINYFLACDTLGCMQTSKSRVFYGRLAAESDCRIGMHVHNDFGLATANTLAGIEAGATLFSGTFTGIGERAGNAPLEEVCVALRYLYGFDMGLKYDRLSNICSLVQKYSGINMQKHKPIIGENAFAHESGIHVDGILKNPLNYEYFNPKDIGQTRKILYGKQSGKAAIKFLIEKYGLPTTIDNALAEIKQISSSCHKSFSEQEAVHILSKPNLQDIMPAYYGV